MRQFGEFSSVIGVPDSDCKHQNQNSNSGACQSAQYCGNFQRPTEYSPSHTRSSLPLFLLRPPSPIVFGCTPCPVHPTFHSPLSEPVCA